MGYLKRITQAKQSLANSIQVDFECDWENTEPSREIHLLKMTVFSLNWITAKVLENDFS
jgi:hypothetical protein